MIKIYTQLELGKQWLEKYQNYQPIFACILGFTATGLIPGISAAGATPESRKYTALADAEFLINGVNYQPKYPLPPLTVGASPVFISKAVIEAFKIPVYLFNAGLPKPPAVTAIDLGGMAANCLTTGQALPLNIVKNLFNQGLNWGQKLAQKSHYLILGECVVGGTTTALALLTGLGIDAKDKINSSHPTCNHEQKWQIVSTGLNLLPQKYDPFTLVAAIGDPMQIVVAGMAIAASKNTGVILAGGTQMLAVYGLIQSLSQNLELSVKWENIMVGTTSWVAQDSTGDTIGLALNLKKVSLLATQLNFATSRYHQLQVYEQGYVKEGVGAGGLAIAAHILGWESWDLVKAIDLLLDKYQALRLNSAS